MEIEVTRRAAATGILSLAGTAASSSKRGRAIEPSTSSYAQAWLIEAPSRLLFISGQVPTDSEGNAPTGFAAQARLAWENVRLRLQQVDMSFAHLAKVTIFLSDRRYRGENTRIRAEVLGAATPAITVIIATIFEEDWLLEIEAIACA